MNDSDQHPQRFDDEIDRRSFIGAAGAASISQIDSIKTLLANSGAKTETRFIEAALEFELLDDGITPARKEGPYRYHALRSESALFALARMEPENFSELVTAKTVTFGLESFETGDATFTNDELSVLPTLGSDTPRVTRYIRLDQWSEAPSYSILSSGNDATIVEVAGKRVEVQSDTARRIELDEREIPSDDVPGHDGAGGVRVSPRLEVRNYGRMEIYDARERAWRR